MENPIKKTTRSQAIALKCKDCIFDSCAPGSWRKQVEECPSYDCALYLHRPRSKSRKITKEKAPIKGPNSLQD